MPFLEIESLHAGYGELEALRGATLEVGKEEVVALVGANGAGKSTLINAISGLVRPTSGSIRLEGRDLTRLPPHQLPAAGVVQVPEGRRLFANLTVQDNLALGAFHRSARAASRASLERVNHLLPILRERAEQRAGTLSGGQQQMLAIGRALMAKPKLLMLDEPSLGLAPIVVTEMFALIKAIRAEGTSILLVEQNVGHALAIADRAYALQQGRVVMSGTGEELLSSDRLASAMLGIA